MGIRENQEERKKASYSLDSFCREVAKYFEERVKEGRKYCGMYLHTSDGYTQVDLNLVREGILSKLEELNESEIPIIASKCPPDNLEIYNPNFPNIRGWYSVDVGWFAKNGILKD